MNKKEREELSEMYREYKERNHYFIAEEYEEEPEIHEGDNILTDLAVAVNELCIKEEKASWASIKPFKI